VSPAFDVYVFIYSISKFARLSILYLTYFYFIHVHKCSLSITLEKNTEVTSREFKIKLHIHSKSVWPDVVLRTISRIKWLIGWLIQTTNNANLSNGEFTPKYDDYR